MRQRGEDGVIVTCQPVRPVMSGNAPRSARYHSVPFDAAAATSATALPRRLQSRSRGRRSIEKLSESVMGRPVGLLPLPPSPPPPAAAWVWFARRPPGVATVRARWRPVEETSEPAVSAAIQRGSLWGEMLRGVRSEHPRCDRSGDGCDAW